MWQRLLEKLDENKIIITLSGMILFKVFFILELAKFFFDKSLIVQESKFD